MPFERLIGALAFLSLIPLIIMYLRRPKPVEETMPSLMFFMHERGTTRFHSFLQQFIRNLLFLVQLAAISVLAFSIMGFFTEVPADKSGRTVIVLDVSGSMQAEFEGSTRFGHAISKAGEALEGRLSIVLAANVPRVILEDGSTDEAAKLLATVKPLDTSSNIGDAILVAKEILKGKGEIVVLSDFIATEGLDPLIARSLVSEDAVVRFVNLGSSASNVGIIDLVPGKATTVVTVKNFDDDVKNVPVKIVNGNSVKDEAVIELGPNSVEEFAFDTLIGRTEARLEFNDDFASDNVAYVSIPDNAKINVLLITNQESSNVQAALSASPNVILDVARPPVVSKFDYDVIVLHSFDPSLMLPGFYRAIDQAVSNGSSLVVTGQDNLATADIRILPVRLTGIGNISRNVVNVTNYFTDGIDFGANERYLKAVPKEGATTIVTADTSPVLSLASYGTGSVVYYGIIDSKSTFKSSPGYPQFWNRLLNFLTKTEDLTSFNFKTGRLEVIGRQDVDTPLGSIKTDRVLFDKSGFYSYNNRVAAANMLNVRESDVSSDRASFNQDIGTVVEAGVDLTEVKHFYALFALVAFLLVFLELLYVKFRGDL